MSKRKIVSNINVGNNELGTHWCNTCLAKCENPIEISLGCNNHVMTSSLCPKCYKKLLKKMVVYYKDKIKEN